MAESRADAQPAPTSHKAQINTSLFYCTASIHDEKVPMLLDSGSEFTIIRKDVWQELSSKHKLQLQPFGYPLKAADGHLMNIWGTTEVPIVLAGQEFRQDVLVGDIDTKGILGNDFFVDHKANLEVWRQFFSVDGVQVPVFKEKHVSFCCRVAVARTVVIEPGREMIIPGKMVGRAFSPKMGMIESTNRFQHNKPGILVAKSVIDPSSRIIPLRVMNINPEPVTIYDDTHIALIQPVDVITEDEGWYEHPNTDFDAEMSSLLERSNPELDETQRQLLQDFLEKNQNVFAKPGELGRTTYTYHQIDTGNQKPIKQPIRRVPYHKRLEITKQVQEMLDQGVISPSESPWNNPVLLVMKKDGTARFCLDMRRLNDCTRKDAYPLPRIDDSFDALSGSCWFSTMDLASGYWQVEIDPQDRCKTAFSAGQGHYHFNVMSFGLCNAPATFERLMERVLSGLQWEICLVYLDDIIVMSSTFEQHLERLEKVFARLRDAGLKLKPKKCNFFCSEVLYLGHLVTSKGLATDPDKVEKVKNWPIPRSLKQVRAFLGLAGYYRKFIRNFSVIASPLHKLTQKDVRFKWTEPCNAAFQSLKDALVSAPVLGYPDFSQDFILDTDACLDGSGAVLSQVLDGQERVIAYASKKFSKAERRYSVTRQELLAVVIAVKHFRHYLYGRKFVVRTDHGSLRWLMNFKEVEGQMARWIETLSMFQYTIEHRPGTRHGNADALSRRPHEDEQLCSEERQTGSDFKCGGVSLPKQFSLDETREAQRADSRLEPLILALESKGKPSWKEIARFGVVTKSLWMQWQQLELHDGILYRSFERVGLGKTLQLVVPPRMRKVILQLAHDHRTSGHLGRAKTVDKVRQSYFWVNYRRDVEDWVRSCVKCQRRKGTPKKRRAAMQPSAVGFPLERVAMDIMGPLPVSVKGNRYVLVIMDYFTKWAEAFPLPNQEAETIAEVFVTQFACRYGVPKQLHTDRGKNFDSLLLRSICKLLDIDKTLTSAYRPQSDGLVERMNRTIIDMISKYVQYDQRDWDVHLPFVLMAYRSSIQESSGLSPNLLMFGREVGIPLGLVAGRVPGTEVDSSELVYSQKIRERLEEAFEIARESSLVAQQRQKNYYDLKVCGQPFNLGEKVWVYNPAKTKGISPKLQSRWQGPCEILRKLSDANYIVKRPRARKTEVVHFDRLKPCYERFNEEDPEESMADDANCDTGESIAVAGVNEPGTSATEDRRPHATNKRRTRPTDGGPQSTTEVVQNSSTIPNQNIELDSRVPETLCRTRGRPKVKQRPNPLPRTVEAGQTSSTNSEIPDSHLSDKNQTLVRPQRKQRLPTRYQDFVMDAT